MIRYFTIKNKTKILILALYSWILPWGFPQQVKMKICIRDWWKVQLGNMDVTVDWYLNLHTMTWLISCSKCNKKFEQLPLNQLKMSDTNRVLGAVWRCQSALWKRPVFMWTEWRVMELSEKRNNKLNSPSLCVCELMYY